MMEDIQKYNKNVYKIILMAIAYFSSVEANSKCIPLQARRFNLCKNAPYNETMFPNLLKHRSLEEASQEMAMFGPLIKIDCAAHLELFLCSVYAPACVDVGPIPPCRRLCESAKKGCINLMTNYGFVWPDYLRCNRYPEQVGKTLCIDLDPKIKNGGEGKSNGNNKNNKKNATSKLLRCPTDYVKDDSKHYEFMGQSHCAAPCKPVYFTSDEKDFARNWVLFWSVVCMLSTAFTLLTFIVDMPRFRYPERPIIFLSGCYFMIANAFIAGPISGNGIACHKGKTSDLLNQGTDHAACTVVFMLFYFFLMSASIWWVILTLTWFLAAGLKWGHEAIESSSQYFHAAAWAIPAAKTIAILAMNQVDGDNLSGVCFVGGQNLNSLRGFVLAPLFVYLVVGTMFLLAGFIALIRIREVLKSDHSLRTNKLTRLMVRIGIFSVLYSLPAIIVIACLFYEQAYRDIWNKSWISKYDSYQYAIRSYPAFVGDSRPDFAVFMIKYLMLLMVGITSGFWIWSGKTIQSWKRFYYNKILHQRVPQYGSKDGSAHTALTVKTNI